MKIVSWNINGIKGSIEKGFIEVVQKMNADIVCLQELKQAKIKQYQWERYLQHTLPKYHNVLNTSIKAYSGVAILSKPKPLKSITEIGVEEIDIEGRIIISKYKTFYLINIYTPNPGLELDRLDYKLSFNKKLLQICKKLEQTLPVIICGDFNVAHSPNDKYRKINSAPLYTKEERQSFSNLLNAGYFDVFRELNPQKIEYSWWRYSFEDKAFDDNEGWRYDYFVVSNKLKNKILDFKHLKHIRISDHCPLELTLKQ